MVVLVPRECRGRGGVKGLLVYPGRLDLCALGWFDGGLGWFVGGLVEAWGVLGCFNGPDDYREWRDLILSELETYVDGTKRFITQDMSQ